MDIPEANMSAKRMKNEYEYDIALSCAGEDRSHAEPFADLLNDRGLRVVYDEFVKSTLWGKYLYQHLADIYRDRAQYCIAFVSKWYVKKRWTKHELQHAQSRSFAGDREWGQPLFSATSSVRGRTALRARPRRSGRIPVRASRRVESAR